MIGRLPETLRVGNTDYDIRTDYRNVFDLFVMFNDDELTKTEKWYEAVYLMFECFDSIESVEDAVDEGFNLSEAAEQIIWFINCGREPKEEQNKKPVFDWEQDEQMIMSACNKIAGKEIRQDEYIHWWTFLSYFNEIGDGLFTYVVNIRKKLNDGNKLDKAEAKYYRENKDIVDIKKRLTKEEQDFMRYMEDLL